MRRRKLPALKFYGLHNFQSRPMKELIPKHDMPGTEAPLFVDGKELITIYFGTSGPKH